MYGFDVVAFGKLTENYAREACELYAKRMSPYAQLNCRELAPAALGSETPAQIKAALQKEQALLSGVLPVNATIVALCPEGRRMDSVAFADYIKSAADKGVSRYCFIIGSSHGLSESVKQNAALRLSLSDMTLPHQLARVVLYEQLYRAVSIINGLKYHK